MPTYKLIQKVSHPRLTHVLVKEKYISGLDIRHAVKCIRVPEPVQKELEKKYHARFMDERGRITYLELVEDLSERS